MNLRQPLFTQDQNALYFLIDNNLKMDNDGNKQKNTNAKLIQDDEKDYGKQIVFAAQKQNEEPYGKQETPYQTNTYWDPVAYENWYSQLSEHNKQFYQNPIFYQQFYQNMNTNYTQYADYISYPNYGQYLNNSGSYYQQQYQGLYYNSYAQTYNGVHSQNDGGVYSKNTMNQYGYSNIKNGNYIQKTKNYKYNPIQLAGFKQQVPKPTTSSEKSQKLSKNQKRRLKKQQLKEEYQEQQRKIGKWVRLQCKQLIQQMKKMQQQDKKRKQRKKQKLSHLIQIHKQIAKHKAKKGILQSTINKDRLAKRKKLKLSNIKKMKMVYALKNNQKEEYQNMAKYINKQYGLEQDSATTSQKQQTKQESTYLKKIEKTKQDNSDEDYVTQSEQQIQKPNKQTHQLKPHQLKRQKVEQKIQKLMQQQIKVIDYQHRSKLENYQFNNVKLREWVDIIPNQDLQDKCLRLINRLAYKQAIKKITKPEKAKKIITAGIHQSKRTLATVLDKKLSRCIILATNIEKNNLQKGTDDQIQEIINLAHQRKIPVIHASVRSRLGRAFTGKFGPRISVVSIINYQGYQDMMEEMLDQWVKAKKKYQQLI